MTIDNGVAIGWACLQCRSKVVSPLRVGRGDVDTDDVVSFVIHDQLEGDEVWGHVRRTEVCTVANQDWWQRSLLRKE